MYFIYHFNTKTINQCTRTPTNTNTKTNDTSHFLFHLWHKISTQDNFGMGKSEGAGVCDLLEQMWGGRNELDGIHLLVIFFNGLHNLYLCWHQPWINCFFNLLNPSGNYTYHKVWYSKILHCDHMEFMCFLYGSPYKQQILPCTTLKR